MVQPSCKDCTARRPGCHATCELYRDWKAAYQEQKQAIEKKLDADRQRDSFAIDSWAQGRRRNQKKPRKKV